VHENTVIVFSKATFLFILQGCTAWIGFVSFVSGYFMLQPILLLVTTLSNRN
jgi:hypothetical protein